MLECGLWVLESPIVSPLVPCGAVHTSQEPVEPRTGRRAAAAAIATRHKRTAACKLRGAAGMASCATKIRMLLGSSGATAGGGSYQRGRVAKPGAARGNGHRGCGEEPAAMIGE